ncbi:MAG: cytochrome c oxidase subunit II [Fidelibacterota bacterium]
MNDYGFWLPRSASTFSGEIDTAISLVHILMVVMFILWGVFFVCFLLRFRQGAGKSVDRKGYRTAIVPILMVAFVALFDGYMLIGHDIPFWHHLKTDFPPEEESTVVRVVAQQFAWNIHYPGADGRFGRTNPSLVDEQANPVGLDFSDPNAQDDITTVGELRIPVEKPVIIRLSTKDVIHSFSLPVMRVKQDAIPGTSIPLWFSPTRTGSWQIACAQLCGNSHYSMKGILKVETQQNFEAWLAEKAPKPGEEEEEIW